MVEEGLSINLLIGRKEINKNNNIKVMACDVETEILCNFILLTPK